MGGKIDGDSDDEISLVREARRLISSLAYTKADNTLSEAEYLAYINACEFLSAFFKSQKRIIEEGLDSEEKIEGE